MQRRIGLPVFGDQPIESITTPMMERWLAGVDRSSRRASTRLEQALRHTASVGSDTTQQLG